MENSHVQENQHSHSDMESEGGFAGQGLRSQTPPAFQLKSSPTNNKQGPLQLSEDSDHLRQIWDTSNKAPFFDFLRANWERLTHDQDVHTFVATLNTSSGDASAETTDDFWLANTILCHGPEAQWPASHIEERTRRSQAGSWGGELPVQSELTLSRDEGGTMVDYSVEAYFVQGTSSERALVIGGIHGSELSAIEVARRLVEDLQANQMAQPYYSAVIVPCLFPDNAERAEQNPNRRATAHGAGRYSNQRYSGEDPIEPNRQNPALGRGVSQTDASPDDSRGRLMEGENVILHRLIQRFSPSRVAYVHASRLDGNQTESPNAGIYADPRASADGTPIDFTSDAALANAMASHARAGGAVVPGNFRSSDDQLNAVYPGDTPPDYTPQEDGNPAPLVRSSGSDIAGVVRGRGVSNGSHSATEVRDPAHPEADRPALQTITVEVNSPLASDEVPADQQAARVAELNAHAASLREIFLGDH